MHLLETKVAHEPTGWRVDLLEDDGEEVSIKVADGHAASEDEASDRAKEVMVQLAAFGTSGGGRSVNPSMAQAMATLTTTSHSWIPGTEQAIGLPSMAHGKENSHPHTPGRPLSRRPWSSPAIVHFELSEDEGQRVVSDLHEGKTRCSGCWWGCGRRSRRSEAAQRR